METVIAIVLALLIAGAAWSIATALIRTKTVFEYERGLLFDRGRFVAVVGPGRHWLLGRGRTLQVVDVRPQTVAITGQEVLSADGVSVKLAITAEYAIVDPAQAVLGVENYAQTLHVAAQLALREVVSSTPVDELLGRRSEIGGRLTELVAPRAAELGLVLFSIDVRDLTFPGDLKRTFAQVVAARKEGLAALERARGETAALRNLANAARMMESNPALLQLRLIQQLGSSGGNTIVLGVPSSSTPLPVRTESRETPEIPPETE